MPAVLHGQLLAAPGRLFLSLGGRGGQVAEVERKLLWVRYFPPLDAHTTPVGSPLLAPHVDKELRASGRFRIGPEPRSREMGEPGVAPV